MDHSELNLQPQGHFDDHFDPDRQDHPVTPYPPTAHWCPPWAAIATILLLTMALIAIVLGIPFSPRGWVNQFQLEQLVGLAVLLLLFGSCSTYQQTIISQLRVQLRDQSARTEELRRLALFDPLTGLYNRRVAQQRLGEEIARSQRSNYPLIVLCLDVNDLKRINDRYGHLAGDAVLKAFARRIQKAIRFSDSPVRMGGDEFMVLLPECNLEQVAIVLSRLSGMEVEVQDKNIPVSFAAGWAICRPGETPHNLLERADQALYDQKRAGKEKPANVSA